MAVQDQRLPDDLEAQITTIVDERVEEATQELRRERDELQERVDDLEDDLQEREQRIDELREEKEKLREDVDRVAREQAQLKGKLSELEGRLEDGDLADDVEQGADPEIPRETPLEDVVALPDDVAERELDANVHRARFFASKIKSAGSKTPKGYRVTAGEIGRIIDVSLDVDAHPETVRRIISILDEMGKDETHRRKKNGEKRIIVDGDLADRLEAHAAMSRET